MKHKKNANLGFSLIEILVGLTLISILFYSFIVTEKSKRSDLLHVIDMFENMIFEMQNESILQGKICRIVFTLNFNEQKFQQECAVSHDVVIIPLNETIEIEKNNEGKPHTQKKFVGIQTSGSDISIPSTVKILGVGHEHVGKPIISGEVSIYFFPNGEKDAAIIFFSTDDELMGLSISPYSQESETLQESLLVKDGNKDELFEMLESMAATMFEEWKRTSFN